MIGGYTFKEMNPESIVLARGGDKMVVNLHDQKDRKLGEATINILYFHRTVTQSTANITVRHHTAVYAGKTYYQ